MYLFLLTVENEFRNEIFPSIKEAYNLLNFSASLPSKGGNAVHSRLASGFSVMAPMLLLVENPHVHHLGFEP